jgi:septal ring-binding cell division protein DamX
MNTIQIFIIVLAFSIIGVRLYLKYVKKDKDKTSSGSKGSNTVLSRSLDKDDDYEPYAKR